MLNRLLFCKVEPEFFLELFVHIAVLDVRDVRIDHEGDQIQDQVRTLPQNRERCVTKVFKPRVVRGLRTTHPIDHLLTNFDLGGKWLGITPQNVSEIHWGTPINMPYFDSDKKNIAHRERSALFVIVHQQGNDSSRHAKFTVWGYQEVVQMPIAHSK